MTVFNKAPFFLNDGDEIFAKTKAAKDFNDDPATSSDFIENGGSGCAIKPKMKPLPEQVSLPTVLQRDEEAIHFKWNDICGNVEGCHYEVVF